LKSFRSDEDSPLLRGNTVIRSTRCAGTFHPEIEIHYVAATTGRYYVGDFIGEFEPGNLVMTGPNLPHNWISHVAPGEPCRCAAVSSSFPKRLLVGIGDIFPDISDFDRLFDVSRRGALFSGACAERCAPIIADLCTAKGPSGPASSSICLPQLASDTSVRTLASDTYLPDPSGFMTAGVNKALRFINENLTASSAKPILPKRPA
jgi:hypothetical protein